MADRPLTGTQILISVNPKAGARSGRPKVEQLARQLGESGFSAEVHTDIDEVVGLCERYGEEVRCLVTAGGDGTLGLYANLTRDVPLVPYPMGTENLMAKYLKISKRTDELVQLIETGVARDFDAGTANGKLYLLMLGCGFDADVVQRLHSKRKGHISHFSYFKPIVDSIRNYNYPEIRVSGVDDKGETFSTSAGFLFVANLPRYASGLKIVPAADGHDGFLDVCSFRQGSFWHGIRYLSGVLAGRHTHWADCESRRATEVRIESDDEVPFQIDGDPGGVLPVDIQVAANRLQLVCSP